MTIDELAQHIINADMEIQIIQGDRLAIHDLLAFDGLPSVSDYEIGEAIELARQDAYIQSVAQELSSQPERDQTD